MEEVLDLYAEQEDPARPLVRFDEMPYQLIAETRLPLPAAPGKTARYDYEYQRMGTCNLFAFFAPLGGVRHIDVTARRTAADFAEAMRRLVDVLYPEAAVIRVVLDNLNTHRGAALYEAFAPAEARRILRRLAFHYTPKHGSWLNMAEIEWSVLTQQCLDRRIADTTTLAREIAAWEAARNETKATVEWRFTTAKARIKLKHLYPVSSHDAHQCGKSSVSDH